MKIKNIFGGMICLALLASCGDVMDYHEYTDYDSKYVFTNFDNKIRKTLRRLFLSIK